MALQLPATVSDPAVQQCLDFIAAQLPFRLRAVDALPATGNRTELVYNRADDVAYCFNGTEWKALY